MNITRNAEESERRVTNDSGFIDTVAQVPSFQSLPQDPVVSMENHSVSDCDVCSNGWQYVSSKHKTFTVLFCCIFGVVATTFWCLCNEGSLGPFDGTLSHDPWAGIHKIVSMIVYVSYMVFCFIGVRGILFKKHKMVFFFISYLITVLGVTGLQLIYHIFHDDSYSESIITISRLLCFLTMFLVYRLHYNYMKASPDCY